MLRLQFIGHIGKDCTINTVNDRNVINFNVAHTEKYKDKNGNIVEKTTWISCSYWVKSTALAPYLLKGQQVYVEGEPGVDWHNSNGQGANGIVAQQKCNVRNIKLLGKASGGGQPQQPRQQNQQMPPAASQGDYIDPNSITEPIDDLPF